MKKLVLIDSNALVHRAFHALPPLSSPSGLPTNAVYGFVSVLLKMLSDIKPDYIAATFDLAGPTFRHEEYEEYKANRVKAPDELYAQIPMVKELLGYFGIPVYEQSGYEADDIIGSISQISRTLNDLQTIIVTGDLDTLQLVEDKKVVVFTLRKGMSDTITYDEDNVRERFGLAPEQVADFKGLKGDPSDNIPGVPGIGDKTATALIQKFKSIEALYDALEKKDKIVKPLTDKLASKLLENKDMAIFSKKLATIIRNVPLKFELEKADWHKHTDMVALESKCKELGFYSLVKRIQITLGAAVKATVNQGLDLDGTRQPLNVSVRTVNSPSDIAEGQDGAISVLTSDDEIKIATSNDGESVYLLEKSSPKDLARVLSKYKEIVGHDLKPILKLLPPDSSLDPETRLFDASVSAWLCNPEQRDYSLERIYYETAAQSLPNDQVQWPLALWRLKQLLLDKMKSLGVAGVFTDLEMPLLPILAAMERRGISIDSHRINELLTATSEKVNELEAQIYKLAGREFNINSPSQLGDILFNVLGIKGRVRRTGGGALSTAAPELEKLRDSSPIIGLILEYRELVKLKTTYIEPFPLLIAKDGRIHTTYNQTGTATGRLSSSEPNLQNIPTRTELGQRFRAAFIAEPGFKLVSLDYSQLELRLVAHIAQDATMIDAFRAGEDIHTRTASEIFGLAPAQVTRDMRRQAKVLNFGMIYGMGVLGFARAAGVSRDTAKRFIDEYFARFAGVARYMEQKKNEAFEKGYVSTIFGRRRTLPDIRSKIPQVAAQAERMAINHPIQGTGADLMKMAMIAVDRYIQTNNLNDRVRMLLQVHDELVLEISSDIVDEIMPTLRKTMEKVYALDVPLTVDAKVGHDWANMEKMQNNA